MAAKKAIPVKKPVSFFLIDGYDNVLDETSTREAMVKLIGGYAEDSDDDFYVIEGVRLNVKRQASFILED